MFEFCFGGFWAVFSCCCYFLFSSLLYNSSPYLNFFGRYLLGVALQPVYSKRWPLKLQSFATTNTQTGQFISDSYSSLDAYLRPRLQILWDMSWYCSDERILMLLFTYRTLQKIILHFLSPKKTKLLATCIPRTRTGFVLRRSPG